MLYMTRRTLFIMFIAAGMSCSCSRSFNDDLVLHEPSEWVDTYDDVIVDRNNVLYANVIGEKVATKASLADYVALESLIDRSKQMDYKIGRYSVSQIPFKEFPANQTVTLSNADGESTDSMTISRKYLVRIVDSLKVNSKTIVTTFVPSPAYLQKHGSDSFSYIDKSIYEGLAINSDVDGKYRSVYLYGDHPILEGELVSESECSYKFGEDVYKLTVTSASYLTRADTMC